MSNIFKAAVLSIKVSLQIFSVYGCLFNCIHQLHNYLSVKRTIGFMLNGRSVETIFYCIHCREVQLLSHCVYKITDPLELIFVPCFVHTVHIILPKHCRSINFLD